MTHPSPLPPSGTQLGISTVMAGQVLADQDTGAQTIAPADLILLTVTHDGVQAASYQMTPAQAMAVGRALASACGKLINAEIDDTGAPLSPLTRLIKFGAL